MPSFLEILEAKEEIRELMTRYCHTLDFGNKEEWLDCFLEEAIWDNPFFGRHEGKAALTKLVEDYHTSLQSFPHRHFVTNVDINVDIDSGKATCKSYWLYTRAKDGKFKLLCTGQYVDQIEKVDGRWLFKERKAPID
jgi:3-phenylpropionate/cinnamic acid dioxygenase small subunit